MNAADWSEWFVFGLLHLLWFSVLLQFANSVRPKIKPITEYNSSAVTLYRLCLNYRIKQRCHLIIQTKNDYEPKHFFKIENEPHTCKMRVFPYWVVSLNSESLKQQQTKNHTHTHKIQWWISYNASCEMTQEHTSIYSCHAPFSHSYYYCLNDLYRYSHVECVCVFQFFSAFSLLRCVLLCLGLIHFHYVAFFAARVNK